MAKGKNIPAGVAYYDGTGRADSTKGKFHPKKIGSGLEKTAKLSGSAVAVPKPASGSATFPKGVSRGDGTQTRRGTTYKNMGTHPGRPGGTSGNKMTHIPGRVAKHNGKSTPRSVTDPK